MKPKPVCVGCQCFYRPKHNGFAFVEGKPDRAKNSVDNVRGKRCPEAWTPYKLWNADLWECPDCGNQIAVGATQVSEHYLPDFDERVRQFAPTLQVNDC